MFYKLSELLEKYPTYESISRAIKDGQLNIEPYSIDCPTEIDYIYQIRNTITETFNEYNLCGCFDEKCNRCWIYCLKYCYKNISQEKLE